MGIPANLKPRLNEFVNSSIGRAQALVITKAQSEIQRIIEQLLTECPPVEVLKTFTQIIQNIKPIIDSADKKVDQAAKIANQLQPAIQGGRLLIEILTKNPLTQVLVNGVPSVVSVLPPMVPNVLIQETKGQRNTESGLLDWARKLVETLSDEGAAITDSISTAKGILDPIKVQLDQIDSLIQACILNQDLTDEQRKLLLNDIQDENFDPSYNDIKYTSTSGNEYTIKIINDPSSPPLAPKRQAIVQDFRGITVLTGQSSFASRTQVLQEEIKFRIENQLP